MMILVFVEDEIGFANWSNNNKNGYVLNTNGKTSYTKCTNKIHRPDCGTLNMEKHKYSMTTKDHEKYCSNDLNTIIDKADSLEPSWEYCGNCMKEYKKAANAIK